MWLFVLGQACVLNVSWKVNTIINVNYSKHHGLNMPQTRAFISVQSICPSVLYTSIDPIRFLTVYLSEIHCQEAFLVVSATFDAVTIMLQK